MTAKELQRQVQSADPSTAVLMKNLVSLSRTAARIMGQLRSMEDIVDRPKKPVFLGPVISAATHSAEVPTHITMTIDTDGLEPLSIEASESILTMIFEGMIRNAVDAMPDRGSLTIRVAAMDRSNELRIQFIDQGHGIPEHVQTQLFSPFFTTKKDSRGIGLGLWLSRWYVRYLGGDIEVKSELGRGSTFTVRLPAKLDMFSTSALSSLPKPQDNHAQPAKERKGHFWSTKIPLDHKPMICVVEDDEAMRSILLSTLRVRGCDVLWADNKEEALKNLLPNNDFDAFIVDVRLEDNDPENATGLEVVEAALAKASRGPIFVISGWDTSLKMAKRRFFNQDTVRVLDKRAEEVEAAIDDLTDSFVYDRKKSA